MDFAVDSNLLVYIANELSPFHLISIGTVEDLVSRDKVLCVFPQNLIEFWTTATRPTSVNGLGLSITEARNEIKKFKEIFHVLEESAAIYPEWERLVVAHKVSGKNVHDARIVAQMNVHNMSNILTFNAKDFSRYSDINAIEPASV